MKKELKYYHSPSSGLFLKFAPLFLSLIFLILIILFELKIISRGANSTDNIKIRIALYSVTLFLIFSYLIIRQKVVIIGAGWHFITIEKLGYKKKYKWEEVQSFFSITPQLYRIKFKNEKTAYYFNIGVGELTIGRFVLFDFYGMAKFMMKRWKYEINNKKNIL